MPLLEVRDLVKRFRRGGGLWSASETICAVNGVSLTVGRGETFALVGESGSGKSTTARCSLRLVEPTSGEIRLDGLDLLALDRRRLREARRRAQMVFQDPYASLDPRQRAGAIVEEPLVIQRSAPRAERRARVAELFRLVGLDPDHADRYPSAFSGGQRQRIGLARALASNPSLIVADEPVSALDVSVQAQIVNLLVELQERLSLAYWIVTHDLRLVRHLADRVAVMHSGRIIETAPTDRLFGDPRHPYTRALISAMPARAPHRHARRVAAELRRADIEVPLVEVAEGHWARLP
jgi:ABC-type oligopeptide transport system ATPase subunit